MKRTYITPQIKSYRLYTEDVLTEVPWSGIQEEEGFSKRQKKIIDDDDEEY